MRDPLSASAWRAAALALAVGWGVLACGGGGDEAVGEGATVVATARPVSAAAAASRAMAARPCPSLTQPSTARRETAEIEREFSEELRSELASGIGSGAGSVEIADPFEPK